VLIAVAFYEVILALHIIAVVFAFGATFAYPVLIGAITKADTRALPALYRALHAISQRVIMPGVAAIVVFGVYLASHLHLWHSFFVQWGIAVSVVIGAVEGAYLGPREKRLIEVADQDLAAAGDGPVTPGAEHDSLVRRIGGVGALMDLLVIVTIFFMVLRTGA
jgi:integral membrane sensor domain MASE1